MEKSDQTVAAEAALEALALRTGTRELTFEYSEPSAIPPLPIGHMKEAARLNATALHGSHAVVWAEAIAAQHGDLRPLHRLLVEAPHGVDVFARVKARPRGFFRPADWWRYGCNVARKMTPFDADVRAAEAAFRKAGRLEDGRRFLRRRAVWVGNGVVARRMAARLNDPLWNEEKRRLLSQALMRDHSFPRLRSLMRALAHKPMSRAFVRQLVVSRMDVPFRTIERTARQLDVPIDSDNVAFRLEVFRLKRVVADDLVQTLRWAAAHDPQADAVLASAARWAVPSALNKGRFRLALRLARVFGQTVSAEEALTFYVRFIKSASGSLYNEANEAYAYAKRLLAPKKM